MAYIAIVVVDSWHIANNQHFGDIVYDYQSTPVLFPTRMEAIQNAFNVLSKTYSGVQPASKKGLKDEFNNELTYFGREFHIISFEVHKAVNNDRYQLLRFNCEPIDIPADKLISTDAGNNIINVKYYDEDDNEQHAVGYSLIHHWK